MDFDLLSSTNQYSHMDYATMMMMQQMENLQEAPTHQSIIDSSVGSGGSTSHSSPTTTSSSPICPTSTMAFPLHPHLPAGYPPYADASAFDGNQASIEAMREMIFRIAVMQPVQIDPESVKPPKRRNVRISKDPQSVAARHRRERISKRIRILQRLVPGGTKMDTASMLDEAIHYVKFLQDQVQSMERAAASGAPPVFAGLPAGFVVDGNYQCLADVYQQMCEDHAQLQQFMRRS